MKNIKHYFKAFTLVELIIVITILAILATIAFISFQNYVWDARDANRLSTIKNIETWFKLFTLKTWNYPKPDEAKIFTGWPDWKSQLNQWIIWESVSKIIALNTIPLDPKDKSNYVYSTTWNNQYYQIGIDSENTELSFISQTYAESRTSIVRWNYRFDPSLPSVIVVENEALINSWIFSPEVCFVLDNGKNSLHECNQIKSEMNLKEYDNSLIGYWDMETLTWNLLKDLSGNGNHWIFSWSMNYESSLKIWAIGKSLYFSWNYIDIWNNKSLNPEKITLNIFLNLEENNRFHFWKWKGSTWTYYIVNELNGTFRFFYDLWTWRNTLNSQSWIIHTGSFMNLTTSYDWKKAKIYINGLKIWEKEQVWILRQNDNNNFKIGHWYNQYYTRGIIDDIKIYNRALTDEEIFQQSKIAWL